MLVTIPFALAAIVVNKCFCGCVLPIVPKLGNITFLCVLGSKITQKFQMNTFRKTPGNKAIVYSCTVCPKIRGHYFTSILYMQK